MLMTEVSHVGPTSGSTYSVFVWVSAIAIGVKERLRINSIARIDFFIMFLPWNKLGPDIGVTPYTLTLFLCNTFFSGHESN